MNGEDKDGLESLLGKEKGKEGNQSLVASSGESNNDSVAVALSYDPKDKEHAPKVIASGKGNIAERILEEATANEIPVHRDSDLVSILAATDVGEEIPIEAFIAVAEILRFVYEANGKKLSGG